MKKYRIGMILDQQFPPDPRVENEALSLIKLGYDVFLLSYSFSGFSSFEEYRGIKVVRISANKKYIKKMRGLVNVIPVYEIFLTPKIRQFIKEYEIDCLHVHDLYLLGAVLRVKGRLKIPIVSDLHENYIGGLKRYQFSTTFPGNLLISIPKWQRKEKEWLDNTDKIICVIEEAQERLLQLNLPISKISVIPNYINIKEFNDSKIDNSILLKFKDIFVISYLGNFDLHRGLDLLIKGFFICREQGLKAHLLLVGDGKNRVDLERLASNLGMNDFIHFEGYRPSRDLPSYLLASNIGVIPHEKTEHTDNTIPHKLFYYMYYKRPVLVSNCRPLERIVTNTHCGLVFKNKDDEDLAKKIMVLYNDETRRKLLGENGYNSVIKEYNWEVNENRLEKLYEEIRS